MKNIISYTFSIYVQKHITFIVKSKSSQSITLHSQSPL